MGALRVARENAGCAANAFCRKPSDRIRRRVLVDRVTAL
jgi:hypothetical protein